jgi:hypothetical protein
LHGSAIVTRFGATVFAGVSGCGKSTIACAFHRRGYPVLTDDICAIETGAPVRVRPGFPHLLVWSDTLGELGMERAGLVRARPGIDKYVVPLSDGFAREAVPLHKVYILEPSNSELSPATSVRGIEKIRALAANTYRPGFVENMQIEAEHLRRITGMAGVRVRRINRPRGAFCVEKLADLLEGDFAV